MIPIIASLLPILGNVIDKVLPNVAEREKVKAELQLKLAEQELEFSKLLAANDQGQIEINEEEAKSQSLFVAGWRPFVGWTCSVGVAWAFVVKPCLDWTVALLSRFYPALIGFTTPTTNTGELLSLLLGLLGMGGFRMMEKKWGVANK